MKRYQHFSNEQLTGMLNDRDNAAYAELYVRHWEVIYRFARGWKLDHDQAQDVVQETFIRLYAKIGQKDFSGVDLVTYLHRIAKNIFLDLSKHEGVRERNAASLARFLDHWDQPADFDVIEKETALQLQDAISRLPKKTRLVFEKSRLNYLSTKAIAEELNMNEPTVRKHIANAMQKIKAKLGMRFFLFVMSFILWLYKQP